MGVRAWRLCSLSALIGVCIGCPHRPCPWSVRVECIIEASSLTCWGGPAFTAALTDRGRQWSVVRAEIQRLLQEAIARAQAQRRLPQITVGEIPVDPPTRVEHGDYASSIALRLKRTVPDKSSLEIAQIIVEALPQTGLLASAEAVPPGFINFRLADAWLAQQVDEINQAGRSFGRVPL
ncbi:MAG: hypothetical protein C4345_14850, partial [Chloroflexota bacterium]